MTVKNLNQRSLKIHLKCLLQKVFFLFLFRKRKMRWSPFFWAFFSVCNTLRQLGMVFLSWKEVCSDGWHPFKFCHPPLGPLFQTTYPVGWNQTGSSFLPHCQTKLSKSFPKSDTRLKWIFFSLFPWKYIIEWGAGRLLQRDVSVSRPKHHVP